MILDERTEFADALTVVGAAGTILLGDVYDLGIPARDIGAAEHLFFTVTVDTGIITAGVAGTLRIQLVSDAQAAIATDGSATVHWDSGSMATGAAGANPLLAAGKMLAQTGLPLSGPIYERYLGVLVTVGTTATTAGAISAFMTPDKHSMKYYAEGVS